VVRFLTPTRPMILLSFRYLTEDQFWFTFFHEGGHLILHGDRCLILEGDATLTAAEEGEANEFAANTLIPPESQAELLRLPINGRAVMRFARKVGVSPGIVVGQLQHRGLLGQNQLNNLKRRFTWVED
jgi:HTH-type transcriptional regulator / antitoxin HigA